MAWDDVRREIEAASLREGEPQQDRIRREKIAAVEAVSSVPLIVYASSFTTKRVDTDVQIDTNDKTGFLQALSDIADGPLDVLLHSPGGSPNATESIVHLLRQRFGPIRFIIPHTAKSAATMLALSGDEILVGEAAELGPIDPQLQFVTDQRPVSVAARAAIDQFERAASEIERNPQRMAVWLPILRQYGPAFLQECQNAIALSETLVSTWLSDYMFKDVAGGNERAASVAKWLSDHNNFKDHSRPIWIEQLLQLESSMKIRRISDVSKELDGAVMALYWAIDVTFGQTAAVKLIEHQQGSAYVRLVQTGTAVLAPPAPASPPSRAERRRRDRR